MPQALTAPVTSLRAALLGAALSLAAAAPSLAAGNYTAVVGTCEPANLATLQYDLKLTNGAVRKAGRNPPSSLYFCDVPIDDLATAPYNVMELRYIDRHTSGSGHIVARLMRRNIATGGTVEVARVTSVPSASLRAGTVALPAPMDFANHEYFVLVMLTAPSAQVEAHTIRFLTR